MPSYTFENLKTGEVVTHVMTISEWETFCKDNESEWKQIIVVPTPTNYRASTKINLDSDFKARLKQISKNHPGSNVNTFGA